MKISLIIPIYNVEPYLRKCLDSAAKQNFDSYEIIMVDDGSTDNSYHICQEYAAGYGNMRVVHQANAGLSAAWMAGLKIASGEFIAFLDSDDWLDPEYLNQLYLGTLSGAEIVCCNRVMEYEKNRIFQRERLSPGLYDERAMEESIFPRLLNDGTYLGRGISPNRCGKLFKKSLLEENLYYCDQTITYGEDLNIVFPAILDCKTLMILNDTTGLYHYRQNRTSITRAYKRHMFSQIRRLFTILNSVLQDKQRVFMQSQLKGDYLTLFLEYVKNEAAFQNQEGDTAARICMNYQEMKHDMAGIPDIHFQCKLSDRAAIFFLEHNCVSALAVWMCLYRMGRYCLRGADLKFLLTKTSPIPRILMVGPHASVKGGMWSVVNQYLTWDEGWDDMEILYIPTFIEGNTIYKICFFLTHFIQILHACCVNKIALAHLHVSERGSFYRKALVLILCKKCHIPVILHHHGAEFLDFYDASGTKQKKWIRKILQSADLNLVLSQKQMEQMEQRFPDTKFTVLYNSIEVPDKNHYSADATGILFAGRLGSRKGVYDLLKAIRLCESRLNSAVKLYLCGDGEVEAVQKLVSEWALESRVAHVGWCSQAELREIRKRAMIFILPSYNEGLPMALLEAMSQGIPCIVGRTGAIPEVITDGVNGFLVTPGNVEEIAKKITHLAANAETRNKFGSEGYQTVKDNFNLPFGMKKIKGIYAVLARHF